MTDVAPARYALGIEYDGTAYNGWQIQPHAPSIQAELNDALSSVADAAVECVGAGRTDTGVHAAAQVAHFDTLAERPARSWLLGINSNLPSDINVLWVAPVAPDFHARFSALRRTYRYVILNRPVRSALYRTRAWWVRKPLDETLMHTAAQVLVGTHDFSSFRASSCQSHTPVRNLTHIRVWREAEFVYLDCRANAFLHHMVRNLAGSLAKVGAGEAPPDWIAEILESRDRTVSGITAPAEGLTLTGVEYPQGMLPLAENPAALVRPDLHSFIISDQ